MRLTVHAAMKTYQGMCRQFDQGVTNIGANQ